MLRGCFISTSCVVVVVYDVDVEGPDRSFYSIAAGLMCIGVGCGVLASALSLAGWLNVAWFWNLMVKRDEIDT